MRRSIIDGERVAEFVGKRTKTFIHQPYTALGIERDGEVIAGVVFNCYTGTDVEVTVASERGAVTRAFLSRVASYVFDELNCIRVSFTTESEAVVMLVHRMGGRVEGRKRNYYGEGRDGILLGMLKEEWKL